MSIRETTGVAIVGAGPAGLTLGHILAQAGVPFRIVEATTREHLLGRIRAGVLEQGTVDLLTSLGMDADLRARGLTHHGIYLQYEGERHHLDFDDLVGRTVTVYGQQALVAHLLAEHDRAGLRAWCSRRPTCEVHGIDRRRSPSVRYTDGDGEVELRVRHRRRRGRLPRRLPSIAARRRSRSRGSGRTRTRWLGILADVAPSTDDLIYALHPDGFAMHSMRSPAGLAPLPAGGAGRVDRRAGATTGSGTRCRRASASPAGR